MRKLAVLLLTALSLSAELPKLIPREVLFGTPPRGLPMLSPDGRQLAYVAPDEKDIANVWVMPAEGGQPKLLTHESRPIWRFDWSGDAKRVLFQQDDGDENTHVFSVDLPSGNIRDLTPFRNVRTQRVVVNPKFPNEILVDLNLRDRSLFDVHRVNLDTGAVTLEATNPGDVNSWVTDKDFVTRAATAYDVATGNTIVRVRDSASTPWRDIVVMPFHRAPFMGQIANGSVVAGFAPDGRSLYIASALHSDTARIERVDAKSGATLEVVAEHPKSDSGEQSPLVLTDPTTGAMQAVKFDYLTFEWSFIDARVKEDLQSIAKQTGRFPNVIDRSADDTRWIISAENWEPNHYYMYDRKTKKLTFLWDEGEDLKGYQLAETQPVIIKARDGMELVSYLTIPPGASGKNMPTIIFPHGGPWERDWLGWNPELQFLVNRGFAVLQVNHRGSTGLGIRYFNAGDGQVGTGMVDDYVDATRWAIAQGIADPKKILLYAGSMGGYATLRLLAREPDLYVAGVVLMPITELRNALDAFPPYWIAARDRWVRRIGGDIMHDDARNRSLSPLYDVAKIRKPLFIAAGGHDVRARAEHIERFVKTLREAKGEVTYVLYPDEGHGFSDVPNMVDAFGRIEEFLAKYAGTPALPWKKLEDSSAELH